MQTIKTLWGKFTAQIVRLFIKSIKPETNEEAILNDYLRIQQLRREEERRFRQFYWGRFE